MVGAIFINHLQGEVLSSGRPTRFAAIPRGFLWEMLLNDDNGNGPLADNNFQLTPRSPIFKSAVLLFLHAFGDAINFAHQYYTDRNMNKARGRWMALQYPYNPNQENAWSNEIVAGFTDDWAAMKWMTTLRDVSLA